MKRQMKKMICMTIMLAMIINLKFVSKAVNELYDTPYTTLPTKETIVTDEVTTIQIGVGSSAESISNIRSKNKKLTAKLYMTCTDTTNGGKWYFVQLYSKKAGVYKVAYTYTNAKGKNINKTLKVKVTSEEPCKYVKLKGKKLSNEKVNIVTYNTAKLNVKMNKGYKLKKIELVTSEYTSTGSTNQVTTKVKNNSKIKISSIPYTVVYRYKTSELAYYRKLIDAQTEIVITYKDKYSKKNKTITYTLIKRLV